MKNLRKLREECGLSQQKLAEIFSISQQSIYKYENGLAEPNLELLIKFSKYFHTSIDHIVGNSDEHYIISYESLSVNEAHHIDIYRKLSASLQKNIDSLIEEIIKEN